MLKSEPKAVTGDPSKWSAKQREATIAWFRSLPVEDQKTVLRGCPAVGELALGKKPKSSVPADEREMLSRPI